MFKNMMLWICLFTAFMIGLCTTIVAAASTPVRLVRWDEEILRRFVEMPFIISVFTSMFLGTDFSNGTLRNKLIIGSNRTAIYFSNLAVVVSGGLMIMAAELLPSVVYGIRVAAVQPGIYTAEFWKKTIVCMLVIISYCALLTLLGMISTKKAITVVSSIGITILCFVTAPIIKNKLDDQSGYYRGYVRAALTFADNALPFGTINRANGYSENLDAAPLYSLGVITVSTGVGVAIFRKRDLR